jgi:ParB family chromosome partitioning protein
MAEFVRLSIGSIHIGERQRPIDEEYAQALASSIAERGLINPITVRSTPAKNKGKTPYTLVAGGHRIRAFELLERAEIEAMVVAADETEAQLIEISENLYRNELSAIDRAVFVSKFREIWEEQNGQINPNGGRPSKKQGHDDPVFSAPGIELSKRVQERLGVSHETYKRISRIAKNLHPDLRARLRGTEAETDQSQLLKLARLEPEKQLRMAAALDEGVDFKTVLSWTRPVKPDVDPQIDILDRLIHAWAKADENTRAKFLNFIEAPDGFKEAAE